MGEGLRSLVETLAAMRLDLRRLVEISETHPLRGLGPEDLLTEEEVSRYVHVRREEARAWLQARRVVPHISPGRARIPLYRVADVRLALTDDRAAGETSSARRRLNAGPEE